jgi:hypothetical protein
MKTFTLKSAVLLLCWVVTYSASAINIVGYVNLPIYAGDNLIANQLDATSSTTDNTLNSLFSSPSVPNGATFTEWDPSANAYLPVSTYNSSARAWDINYNFNTFSSGQGGILHLPLNSPSPWTETFVGTVVPYGNIAGDLGGPLWNPNYANGLYLIACPEPLSGPMNMMFTNVVGRLPQDGEWVKILNPATQTYTTTTFHTGTGWNNGDPSLGAGEAAWFDLGPVVVPEPSSLAIVGGGVTLLAVIRRRRVRADVPVMAHF